MEQSGASVCWTWWEVFFSNDGKTLLSSTVWLFDMHGSCCHALLINKIVTLLSHRSPTPPSPCPKTSLHHTLTHSHTISPVEVLTWHLLFVKFPLWVFQRSSALQCYYTWTQICCWIKTIQYFNSNTLQPNTLSPASYVTINSFGQIQQDQHHCILCFASSSLQENISLFRTLLKKHTTRPTASVLIRSVFF